MTRRGAAVGGGRTSTKGRDTGDGEFQYRADSDHSPLAARALSPPHEETGLGRGGPRPRPGAGEEEDLGVWEVFRKKDKSVYGWIAHFFQGS